MEKETRYNPDDGQKFCRSAGAFAWRDLLARVYLKLNGKL